LPSRVGDRQCRAGPRHALADARPASGLTGSACSRPATPKATACLVPTDRRLTRPRWLRTTPKLPEWNRDLRHANACAGEDSRFAGPTRSRRESTASHPQEENTSGETSETYHRTESERLPRPRE
jgi:hypothetical protein